MKMIHVVAVARNNVIGDGNKLLWKIADDLKFFKKNTVGKPVIMGRKTFQSIGMVLPGRDNIVISRTANIDKEGVFVVGNISAAITLAQSCAEERGADEICVIGGGEIYRQTLALTDRIFLTAVDAGVEGDTTYPSLAKVDWRIEQIGACSRNERNQYDCKFFIYDRISRKSAESPDN